MEKKFELQELSRYPNGTFAHVIQRNALLLPGKIAFIYGEEKVSFREFNDNVNKLVRALYFAGLKKGDVIGILSRNCLDYTYVLGAAIKGGFIASPYNPRLNLQELEYLLGYSQAKVLFVGPELVEMARQLRAVTSGLQNIISFENAYPDMTFIKDLLEANFAEEPKGTVSEDDPVIIVYTGGTTGLSKGAVYTQGRLTENAKVVLTSIPVNSDDKNILVLQLFHVAALESFQVTLYAGATSILLKDFEPSTVMQTIQGEKATTISLIPTGIAAILSLPDLDKYNFGSLTRISYMGSTIPVLLLKRAIDKFGLVFCQQYGQTESGPLACYLPPSEHKAAYGSVEEQNLLRSCGRPPLGVQVRIVDSKGNDVESGEIGEIVLRSKEIMKEYWKKPGETEKTIIGGWLHTRDMGYYDENGYIYIADRKQDMIITGGEHVFPREVEEVLYQHPFISEAAVIGVPDQYWVERVHAVVVLKQGRSLTVDELIRFCKERIDRYKAPKSCEFVDALPKNATGRILKSELRKRYRELL